MTVKESLSSSMRKIGPKAIILRHNLNIGMSFILVNKALVHVYEPTV